MGRAGLIFGFGLTGCQMGKQNSLEKKMGRQKLRPRNFPFDRSQHRERLGQYPGPGPGSKTNGPVSSRPASASSLWPPGHPKKQKSSRLLFFPVKETSPPRSLPSSSCSFLRSLQQPQTFLLSFFHPPPSFPRPSRGPNRAPEAISTMTEGEDGIASVHDGGDGFSIGKLAGAATSRPGGLTTRAPGDGALSLAVAGTEMAPPWQPQESRAGTTRRSDQPSQASDTVPVPHPQAAEEDDDGDTRRRWLTPRPQHRRWNHGAGSAISAAAKSGRHRGDVLSPVPRDQYRPRPPSPAATATPVAGGSHRAPVFPSTGDGASSSTERRHDSASTAEDQSGKSSLELSIYVDEIKGPKRKRSSDRNPWIRCLPDDLVENILVLHTMRTDLNNVMASSFFFLRAGLLPCPCHSLGQQPRLVAALVQTKRGLLKVAALDGPRLRWLEPAASMLNKFLNLTFHSRGWVRPVDCRSGTVAVIRDRQARVVELLRPFEGQKITTLPEAPCYDAADVLTGGLIPGEAGAFRFFLLSRIRGRIEQLSLKTFSSATGLWEVQQMSFPFALSRTLEPRGVFASGRHYVLDHENMKLLAVDLESHTTDAIVLPAEMVQSTLCYDNNTLAVSRGGELYWIVLDGFFLKFFVLSGADWFPRWKRMIPDHVPSNMHTVQLVGHSASNGVVLMRCFHQVFAIDIEDGSLVKFKDCRDGSCTFFAFEMIQHVIADHVRRM